MKPKEKSKKFQWIKRGIALTAVAVWLALIVSIFQSGGTMADQAPKCIFTTMIVFGILTAIYKGLEQWEKDRF